MAPATSKLVRSPDDQSTPLPKWPYEIFIEIVEAASVMFLKSRPLVWCIFDGRFEVLRFERVGSEEHFKHIGGAQQERYHKQRLRLLRPILQLNCQSRRIALHSFIQVPTLRTGDLESASQNSEHFDSAAHKAWFCPAVDMIHSIIVLLPWNPLAQDLLEHVQTLSMELLETMVALDQGEEFLLSMPNVKIVTMRLARQFLFDFPNYLIQQALDPIDTTTGLIAGAENLFVGDFLLNKQRISESEPGESVTEVVVERRSTLRESSSSSSSYEIITTPNAAGFHIRIVGTAYVLQGVWVYVGELPHCPHSYFLSWELDYVTRVPGLAACF